MRKNVFVSNPIVEKELLFFLKGHGNDSCNLIGSQRGPDFPPRKTTARLGKQCG